jgi:hypothetical protein
MVSDAASEMLSAFEDTPGLVRVRMLNDFAYCERRIESGGADGGNGWAG